MTNPLVLVALAIAALGAAAAGRRNPVKPADELQSVVEQVDKHGPAKPSPAKPSPAKPSPAKPSPAKPSPAKPSPAKPSPARREPGTPENPIRLPAMVVNVDGAPPGYDPKKARASAKQMAAHLKAKRYSYSRKALAIWQEYAGISHDGKYGPNTEGALRYFGAAPPPAFFNPQRVKPYYVPQGG